MGFFGGIGSGISSLQAHELAIRSVGVNISNAYSQGYTRQRVRFVEREPDEMTSAGIRASYSDIGSGVSVDSVRRVREKYLDIQLRSEIENNSKWEYIATTLERIEQVLNEPNEDSLSGLINEFWQGWNDLASMPEDFVIRKTLIEKAQMLCEKIQYIDQQLLQIKQDLNQEIEVKIDQLNEKIARIGILNTDIVRAQGLGLNANEARDERDVLIEEIAQIAGVVVNEQNNGAYALYLGGVPLVLWYTDATEFEARPVDGLNRIVFPGTNQIMNLEYGELGGILYSRDTIIPEYEAKLDVLAQSFITEVNKLHSTGIGINSYSYEKANNYATFNDALASENSGNPFYDKVGEGTIRLTVYDSDGNVDDYRDVNIDSSTTMGRLWWLALPIFDSGGAHGSMDNIKSNLAIMDGYIDFEAEPGYTFNFQEVGSESSNFLMALGFNAFFSGTDAATISVNPDISSDPFKISASSTTDPGGNSVALQIAGLQNEYLLDSGTKTINSYFSNDIVGAVGFDTVSAKQQKEIGEIVVNNLENKFQSVSGVSFDEEMTNLISFQSAYTAASQYILLSDEMVEDMIYLMS